jgi:voltage-gated potassium channel
VTQGEKVALSRTEAPHSNSYNIFILVLTILSLVVMGLLLLPLSPATLDTLRFYDNFICVIFLVDFALNLRSSQPKRDYLVTRRGWLDLLGSIPSLGVLQITALFRLFRLSRLARIGRLLKGDGKKRLVADIVKNRGQYAIFITALSALVVLTTSSVLILQFESRDPNANIVSGGDALWWAIVTITTVGYGDFYPVTFLGRDTAVVVMLAGVGIIGALASILASMLVPQPNEAVPDPALAGMESELAGVKAELTALRELMAADRGVTTG